jgi:putative nucleotidyltransferase with HDIG domain
MSFEPKKARARRIEIRGEVRRDRPSLVSRLRGQLSCLKDEKSVLSLLIAVVFAVGCGSLLMLRPGVVDYRPGQVTREPVFARGDFSVLDDQRLSRARQRAADATERVYRPADRDPFTKLEDALIASPDRVTGLRVDQLGELTFEEGDGLVRTLGVGDGATLARLQEIASTDDPLWPRSVRRYIESLRRLGLVLVDREAAESDAQAAIQLDDGQRIAPGARLVVPATEDAGEALQGRVSGAAFEAFGELIYPKVVRYTAMTLGPTIVPDLAATARVRAEASMRVPESLGEVTYREGQRLFAEGHRISEADWNLLRAENRAFRQSLGGRVWAQRIGLFGLAAVLTVAMAMYTVRFRPKIAANPARAACLAILLLSCLLVSQLAALGSGSLILLALGPIFLAGITLSIAYDGRFAMGLCGLLALLVTIGLGAGVGFYVIAFAGLLPATLLPGGVASRSRLIEVGGAVGITAAVTSIIVGLSRMDPGSYLLSGAAWAALTGFAAGGIVLCTLPFIERIFQITTGLTLLEYLDHPLLRRLAMEAPGTYNHSLQVATISEEAAKAIDANGLLCRVACYYHDVGKLRKPDYFIENQRSHDGITGGNTSGDAASRGAVNPHLTLNPSMSLIVIIGHVKDGLAMAREWKLPRSFLPFIEQHHGTTVVEYFYREAIQQQRKRLEVDSAGPIEPDIEETEFRYPGPRPRTRETAIVMLADACESACRAMPDPTPTRLESRVNDLLQKRLQDHQFDECPITMAELEAVRKSIVKSLVGIYHGRIAYPGDMMPAPTPVPAPAVTVMPARVG